MSKTTLIVIGIFIGLAIPFIVDFALFGDFTPCKTFIKFEDGSSLQACSVRG